MTYTGPDWAAAVREHEQREANSQSPVPTSKPKRLGGDMGVIALGIVGVLVSIVALIWFVGFRADVSDLGYGDCLASPGDEEFSRIRRQGCGGAHDAQVFGFGSKTSASDQRLYQSLGLNFGSGQSGDHCLDMFANRVNDGQIRTDFPLPADATIAELRPPGSQGGRTYCILESPSGALRGSLFD